MIDFIVVGAGISGCSIAYFLNKHKHTVKLYDHNGISNFGSKAAGAFLSPMIGKPNRFKDFTNDALKYSINFYDNLASDLITHSKVQRVPKDESDRLRFDEYERYIDGFDYHKADEYGGGFLFDIGASVEAQEIGIRLSKDIEVIKQEVTTLTFHGDYWLVNQEKCKHVILATGAFDSLIDEPYIKLKRLWGQRIVVETSTNIPHNLHKNCSVSKSKDGKLSIGATYLRGVLHKECDDKNTKELLQKVDEIVKLEDVKVIDRVCGTRSATDDYFPIIGRIIDSQKSIAKFPNLKNGQKISAENLIYHPNLFMINGLGSRAFVLAPKLAFALSENILNGKKIDDNITINRLFTRWVKRI
jgi:glycine/D-amino acid oxidase-like deaminating enzyme